MCCCKKPHVAILRTVCVLYLICAVLNIFTTIGNTQLHKTLLADHLVAGFTSLVFGIMLLYSVNQGNTTCLLAYLVVSTVLYTIATGVWIYVLVTREYQELLLMVAVLWTTLIWFIQLGVFWSYKKMLEQPLEMDYRKPSEVA